MIFQTQLRQSLKRMYRTARQRHYEYISVDQLAYCLLEIDGFRQQLSGYGISAEKFAKQLLHCINELTPRTPISRADCYPRLTSDMRAIIAFGFRQYADNGRAPVDAGCLLGPILMCQRSFAAQGLKSMGLPPARLRGADAERAQSYLEARADETVVAADTGPGAPVDDGSGAGEGIEQMVARLHQQIASEDGESGKLASLPFPVHISKSGDGNHAILVEISPGGDPDSFDSEDAGPEESAGADSLLSDQDPDESQEGGRALIGRDDEVRSVARILMRKDKNNVLLIGEEGVGKTALIRHLMRRGQEPASDAAEGMGALRWHQLNGSRLLASMRYRGGIEKELGRLLGGDNLEPVLVIDNLGELIGPGSGHRGNEDVARVLLSAIDRPGLRVLGACSYKEYHSLVENSPSLARRFQTIDIDEPDRRHTRLILDNLKPEYELYHGVRYPDEALDHILACADRFDLNRYFPEKAVDIMDEVGSYTRLREGREAVHPAPIEIDFAAIEAVARMRARIDKGEGLSLNPIADLSQRLSRRIFNQGAAIDELVKTLKISFSELQDSSRLRGCFLFVGPTGVGKTELSTQLAAALNMPMHRYDMSEFAERHSTARLIGAPPGYVGFEGGGQLISDVRKAPHSVILLDELEKAHPDVLNLLLQMMDYGTLTASSGARTRFHHCILIATTNAGAAEVARSRPGFVESDNSSEYKQQLSKSFSPEFINRFDSIVYFNSHTVADLAPMVAALVDRLNQSLADRGLSLSLDEAFVDWLCREAFDSKLGARPLARMFQEKVKLAIADFIASAPKSRTGLIKGRIVSGQPSFTWPE